VYYLPLSNKGSFLGFAWVPMMASFPGLSNLDGLWMAGMGGGWLAVASSKQQSGP